MRSLRTRLVFTLALVLAFPAALGITQGYYNYREQQASAERSLAQAARLVVAEYKGLMADARKVLTTLAAQPDVRNFSRPACRFVLDNALALLPEYDRALVANTDGSVRCGSRDIDSRVTVRGWPWFQSVMQGSAFTVDDFEANSVVPRRTLVAAIPVRDAAHNVTGVLALFVKLETLERLADRQEPIAEAAHLAILDRQGNALPIAESAPVISPETRDRILSAAMPDEIAVLRAVDRQGQETVFAVATLPFAGLLAVLAQSSRSLFGQSVFGGLGGDLAVDLAPPFLIWLVAVATAGVAIHRFVIRWVLQLRRMVLRFLYDVPMEKTEHFENAPQEMRDLAESFIKMMQTIEARNAQLNGAVAHRDMLIKEIHHRVKNNLQIISSLLNLQSRSLRDEMAREALLGFQSRINALALIHQSLYETQEQQMVELQGFLGALCNQLEGLVSGRHIYVVSVIPRYFVSAETAVTLAMLITEIVTNATKHAFKGQNGGRVLVEMEVGDGGRTILSVSDNGSGGFTLDETDATHPGLGQKLIKGYVRQLQGDISVAERDGTHILMQFANLR